nr:hypothetical protein [Streptomyces sp. Ncost-T10-10d]
MGLEERGLDYVVGISTTTTAHPEEALPHTPPYGGRGPRPQPPSIPSRPGKTGPGPGPLRRPHPERLAPPRHPRLRRPRLLHPPAHHPVPKGDGAGLSLYQVTRELQLLLAAWTGACPICHRNMPEPISTWPGPTRWSHRVGRTAVVERTGSIAVGSARRSSQRRCG